MGGKSERWKKNMSMAETQQHFYQGHMLISRRRAGHIIK